MAKVFIIDDEQALHELYKNVLELNGHEVIENAYNGQDGVNKYEELNPKPELIIMDYNMPVMNGLDAARKILRINPYQKIIFISANDNMLSDLQTHWEGRNLGVSAFIEKPFSINTLSKTVNDVI